MYAVIDNKGKQYKVAEGEEVLLDLMQVDPGETVEFDRILVVGGLDGTDAHVGTPAVDGARVTATVMRHEKGPKVRSVRYKGHSQTKIGHRQRYTRIRVQTIEAP